MSDIITITGLIATTPRHVVTAEGLPITSFRLASSQRRYDKAAKGESAYFVWLNRGKESRVLDLDPPGQDMSLIDQRRICIDVNDIDQHLLAGRGVEQLAPAEEGAVAVGGHGLDDGDEVRTGNDPRDNDSDDDGVPDVDSSSDRNRMSEISASRRCTR